MKSITTSSYDIHFKGLAYQALNRHITSNSYSKIFILVDQNTHELCASRFLSQVKFDSEIEIIEIPAGETHKTIDTCLGVWRSLCDLGADRKSLMINLGGGVVTDLGGFVASTFKRGIEFINIPTSLLAMVDASVGGKTGVDLDLSKNQIGTISFAKMVLIDPEFLTTLPAEEMRSGLAEMLKHGLIFDRNYWNELKNLKQLKLSDLDRLIYHSVVLKNTIVSQDPTEMGIRKFLNYGHTLGHAVESFCLDNGQRKTLLHGEAIAVGMILEGYLSMKLTGLKSVDLEDIRSTILKTYPLVKFNAKAIETIINLLKHDKKNTHGRVNFVLLQDIGACQMDVEVIEGLIYEAFEYYNNGVIASH